MPCAASDRPAETSAFPVRRVERGVQCEPAFFLFLIADARFDGHCKDGLAGEHATRPAGHTVGVQPRAPFVAGLEVRTGEAHVGPEDGGRSGRFRARERFPIVFDVPRTVAAASFRGGQFAVARRGLRFSSSRDEFDPVRPRPKWLPPNQRNPYRGPDPMNEPVLAARSLAKSYLSGDRRIAVLQDVSLAVAGSESISIRGESGSGKSTLLNLLSGLDAPDSGDVQWAGAPPVPERRSQFLGMVFQAFYLIPELNAEENVLMAARILRRPGPADRARAKDLLARVGLAERARHLPSQLSGGERQRVAVARALVNSPKLLLADEPTGNLDERTGDAVIELLLNLCRETGTALVLVTHNVAHAGKTNRSLFLHEGVLR